MSSWLKPTWTAPCTAARSASAGAQAAYDDGALPHHRLTGEDEERVVAHLDAGRGRGGTEAGRGLVHPLDRPGHAQLLEPSQHGRHLVRRHVRSAEPQPRPRVVGPAAAGDEDRERAVLLGVGVRARRLVVVPLEPGQQVVVHRRHPRVRGGTRHTGFVLSFKKLSLALRDAGVVWHPAVGDAFVVPDREMDEEVFVLSDMVIQKVEAPDGPPLLAFNGTTEWALDSLEEHEALWVPREDQPGAARLFLREPRAGARPAEGYAVTAGGSRHVDVTAEAAYARAVLALLALSGWAGAETERRAADHRLDGECDPSTSG